MNASFLQYFPLGRLKTNFEIQNLRRQCHKVAKNKKIPAAVNPNDSEALFVDPPTQPLTTTTTSPLMVRSFHLTADFHNFQKCWRITPCGILLLTQIYSYYFHKEKVVIFKNIVLFYLFTENLKNTSDSLSKV